MSMFLFLFLFLFLTPLLRRLRGNESRSRACNILLYNTSGDQPHSSLICEISKPPLQKNQRPISESDQIHEMHRQP